MLVGQQSSLGYAMSLAILRIRDSGILIVNCRLIRAFEIADKYEKGHPGHTTKSIPIANVPSACTTLCAVSILDFVSNIVGCYPPLPLTILGACLFYR